jgi:hypothetical protein
MSSLRVDTFGWTSLRGQTQASKQICFRDVIDIRPWTECVAAETLSVVMLDRLLVSLEPRLHGLYHEVQLIGRGADRPLPPVAGAQSHVLP